MNLNDIREMVSKDLEMDRTELDIESIKTPQLHNKYLILFTDETLLFKKMQAEYKTLRKDKWLYYTGKMGDDELKQRNWEPFPLNVLRADTDQFIESDRELIIQSHRLAPTGRKGQVSRRGSKDHQQPTVVYSIRNRLG